MCRMLIIGNERRMQPKSKVTHCWNEATTPRWIRHVNEDLRGHKSTQTDSRQAHTHIYDMGAYLAAFWPKTGPNRANPRSVDHHGRTTMWWQPTGPTDSQWHMARCGWPPMVVWDDSRTIGWWFPLYIWGEGAQMRTSLTIKGRASLACVSVGERSRGTQEGHQ